MIIGIVCGTLAALAWAMGFVAAKHGIQIGLSPADLAFHRFFWTGHLVLPLIVRDGLRDLGGIGWSRASAMTILSGPPQSLLAYPGFILVPLGHGTTIQPACAALSGLVLASLILHEKPTIQRVLGGAIIIAGLLMFGAESLATIGNSGVGGDLLFAALVRAVIEPLSLFRLEVLERRLDRFELRRVAANHDALLAHDDGLTGLDAERRAILRRLRPLQFAGGRGAVVAERLQCSVDLLVCVLEQPADLDGRNVAVFVLRQLDARPHGFQHVALDAFDHDGDALGTQRRGKREAQNCGQELPHR